MVKLMEEASNALDYNLSPQNIMRLKVHRSREEGKN